MKKLINCVLYILYLLILLSLNICICVADDGLYLHKLDKFYPDMTYYSVPIEKFDYFVKNPKSISEYGIKFSYFKVPSDEYLFGTVKRDVQSFYLNDKYCINEDNTTIVTWNSETEASYYNLIVEDTFEFMKKENISSILKSNGIFENVKEVALVCVGEFGYYSIYPATIWITTEENNNYYLVYQGDYNKNSTFDVNKIQFMNYIEYSDKYSIKYGELYINNEKVELDTNIMFQCERYLYIPFRALLESLGSQVTWNNESRGVSFTCRGQVYTLYSDLLSFQKNAQDDGVIPTYSTVPFINGTMYIGKGILEDIAEIFDMKTTVDYNNKIINLNNN